MSDITLDNTTLKQIEQMIQTYLPLRDQYEALVKIVLLNLLENKKLANLIHSTKMRSKDPEHLLDKLKRKAIEARKKRIKFDITKDNLFAKIEDLAGVRLLHLHTKQMSEIHPAIMAIVEEHRYKLCGQPVANTWDIENQTFFKSLGLKTQLRPTLYTSVHYIIKPNRAHERRCEIQVRTLAEEIWGEVSHSINYPRETDDISCKEQLSALARVASGCTRLVDSIFTCQANRQTTVQKLR